MMTVGKLISILQTCDPSLPVATHANNTDWMSGEDYGETQSALRVVLLHSYLGPHVSIGNHSRKNLNGDNWHVARELDGGKELPKNHPSYDGVKWNFKRDYGPVCEPSMKSCRKKSLK